MKYLAITFAIVALWLHGAESNIVTSTGDELEAFRAHFQAEIDAWTRTGIKSKSLEEDLAALAFDTPLLRSDIDRVMEERSGIICTVCRSLSNVIVNYRRAGMSTSEIINQVTNLCTALNIESEEVCYGVVSLNADIAMYIVDNKPDLQSDSICGVALQKRSCAVAAPEFEWSIDINEGPAKEISEESTGETFRVVHFSDTHYDPLYEPYGNADCGDPTCCRIGQNATNTNGQLAGFWGDYNCDTPWHAVQDAYEQIKINEPNASWIYFTGDIVDHGVWETTHSGNYEVITRSFYNMKKTFGDTPVYPILANHEPNPMNVFAPSEVTDENLSTEWLFKLVADLWIGYGWLPESTRSTILQGGFYTVSPVKGFRVIGMNDNVAYINNWWLIYKPQDPYGQLKWLTETLQQAEEDGEFVHILTHLPQGDRGWQHTWGREYRKIITRYSHIIQAQFSGHTHNDEFRVIYDLENPTKAINLVLVGGSVTTYKRLNPNYRVYEVDTQNYEIEDAETWLYNLTLANLTPDKKPNWFKSYSFKEEYGVKDLSAASLGDLVLRMTTDTSILGTYNTNFVKHVDQVLAWGCNDWCKGSQLCKIVTTVANDDTQCNHFKTLAQLP